MSYIKRNLKRPFDFLLVLVRTCRFASLFVLRIFLIVMCEKISGVILLFLLLCGVFFLSSCASLGDGVEVRRGHVSSFGADLSARGVWLDSPRSLEECLSFALENADR